MSTTIVKRLGAAALAWALAMVFAASASAAPKVDGTFPVSSLGTNTKIVAGPDGNIWLALSDVTNNVARITPAGQVQEFDLPGVSSPSGIAVGPDGNIWVTQNEGVAKFAPDNPTGAVATTIAQVKNDASIVAGPDGDMWVATTGELIHFNPTNPAGSKQVPVAGLEPKDIDVAGSLLVVADAGNSRIVTMTTAGVEKDYPLAGLNATSQGVAGSPSGLIGYAQSTTPEGLGLIAPPSEPQRFALEGDPFGATLGSDGAFWIALSAAGGVERLTADGQMSFLGGLPAKFFPRQIAAGPGNTLWVTMEIPGENVFEVARISGLEPPVTTPPPPALAPETKIAKGPKGKVKTAGKRAKVKFRFSSTTAGATFECALIKVKKLKKGQKAPKPKFKACKSPKSFSLKPGKYRFWVRAVNAGVVDPTPAKRSFSVVHVRKR